MKATFGLMVVRDQIFCALARVLASAGRLPEQAWEQAIAPWIVHHEYESTS
jgi:hypothetical protein